MSESFTEQKNRLRRRPHRLQPLNLPLIIPKKVLLNHNIPCKMNYNTNYKKIYFPALFLVLCVILIACKGKNTQLSQENLFEQTEEQDFITVPETEQEPADETPEVSTPETDSGRTGTQVSNRTVNIEAQPSLSTLRSNLGSQLPAFGVNIREIDPVNYENPDPAILRQMGVEQYLISFLAGEQYYKEGDLDKALAEYTASINSNRDFIEALISRGNTWLKKGDYTKAIDDYTRSIRLDDSKAELFNYRGYARAELAANNRDLNLAIQDYSQAIALNSRYTDALINRSQALYEIGDYEKVIEDCTRIIALEPQNASAWNRRGSAWYQKKDDDRAINDFTEAIRIRNGYALAWHNRGNAWYNKGDYDKALADMNRALAINPLYTSAYISRGNILQLLGNHESAAADFAEAQRLEARGR
jgi:tetratricopeptide (TPR) repeat protein